MERDTWAVCTVRFPSSSGLKVDSLEVNCKLFCIRLLIVHCIRGNLSVRLSGGSFTNWYVRDCSTHHPQYSESFNCYLLGGATVRSIHFMNSWWIANIVNILGSKAFHSAYVRGGEERKKKLKPGAEVTFTTALRAVSAKYCENYTFTVWENATHHF